MMRPQFSEQLRNQQKVLVMVWYSFVFMILFFLSAPVFVKGDSILSPNNSATEFLRRAFWFLLILQATFLVWWKKRFFPIERLLEASTRGIILEKFVRGAQNPVEKRAGKMILNYFVRSILAFGVAESIALYGLVLTVLGHYVLDQYVLSVVSLVLVFYFFPSNRFFAQILDQANTLTY